MASTEIKKTSLLAIAVTFLISGIILGMGFGDYLLVRELREKGYAQVPGMREILDGRNDRAWGNIVVGIIGVSGGIGVLVYVVMKPQQLIKTTFANERNRTKKSQSNGDEMTETVPTIGGRYKKGLVIGCALILIGLVSVLAIYPLYARQMYDLSRRQAEGDIGMTDYFAKLYEIFLWYGYGMLISRGLVMGGCFLGVFTCIMLFFDRKKPLEANERLGLLVLMGFLLLIAIWHGVSFYPSIPSFYPPFY